MTTFDFRRMYEEIYGAFDYNKGLAIDPDLTALVIVDMQPALTRLWRIDAIPHNSWA